MTQDQRPTQDTPQPAQPGQPGQPQQADSLAASYHAAHNALDAEASQAGENTAGPSAQTRANILAYAAQQPHVRAGDTGTDNSNASNSIAARAVNTAQTGQFNTKKPSANDSQWKLRALASVAIFGISGLLFMQWDRATPDEKDLAFSTARPAPAARPKAEVADAQNPAGLAKPDQSAPQPAQKTAPAVTQQSPPPKPPVVKKPSQDPVDSPLAGAPPQPKDSTPFKDKRVAPQPTSQAEASAGIAPNPAPTPAPVTAPVPAPAPAVAATPPTPAAQASTTDNADAAFSKSAPSGAAVQSAPVPAARSAARTKSVDAERLANAGATPDNALFAAIRSKDLAALQQALAAGADKNAKSGGTPAITLCAQLGQADMVRTLATAGADVNATDTQGISALDHARGRGFSTVMEVLQKFGAR